MKQAQGNFKVFDLEKTIIFDKYRGGLAAINKDIFPTNSFNSHTGFTEEVRTKHPELRNFFHNEATIAEHKQKIVDFAQSKRTQRPTTFFLTQTLNCPLACTYCFEEPDRKLKGNTKKNRLYPEDIASLKRAIDQYKETYNLDNEQIAITLFGGEPLQGFLKEMNEELFSFAAEEGYWVDVVTSGTTVDDYYLDLLTTYKNIIRDVDITLDGTKEVHDKQRVFRNQKGTYDKVKNTIDALLERDVRVLSKQNIGITGLAQLQEHIYDQKAYGWYDNENFVHCINMIKEYGVVNADGLVANEGDYVAKLVDIFSQEEYAQLLHKMRFEGLKFTEFFAYATEALVHNGVNKFDGYPRYAHCHPTDGTTVNISYDGTVFACNWSTDRKNGYGTIDNPEFERLEEEFRTIVTNNPVCAPCNIATLCGGGCTHDQQVNGKANYHLDCQDNAYEAQKRYLTHFIKNNLPTSNIWVAPQTFSFDYAYENRALQLRE